MGYETFEGVRANDYDKNIRILFPQYEYLLKLLGPVLTNSLKNDFSKLLIVGSGTGAEMEQLHLQIPNVHMTGVDISPEMMKIARAKLINLPLEAHNLVLGTVSDLPQHSLYDAATILLVLHFLPDNGSKLKLLKDIS